MARTLIRPLQRFLKNEEGVTAVECALMLALVVVICLVTLSPNTSKNKPVQDSIVVVSE